jgi:hypothetical protein
MGDVEGLRVEGARTKEWWAWGEKMRTRRNGGRWSDSAQGRHTSSNEELREGREGESESEGESEANRRRQSVGRGVDVYVKATSGNALTMAEQEAQPAGQPAAGQPGAAQGEVAVRNLTGPRAATGLRCSQMKIDGSRRRRETDRPWTVSVRASIPQPAAGQRAPACCHQRIPASRLRLLYELEQWAGAAGLHCGSVLRAMLADAEPLGRHGDVMDRGPTQCSLSEKYGCRDRGYTGQTTATTTTTTQTTARHDTRPLSRLSICCCPSLHRAGQSCMHTDRVTAANQCAHDAACAMLIPRPLPLSLCLSPSLSPAPVPMSVPVPVPVPARHGQQNPIKHSAITALVCMAAASRLHNPGRQSAACLDLRMPSQPGSCTGLSPS